MDSCCLGSCDADAAAQLNSMFYAGSTAIESVKKGESLGVLEE